MTEQAKQQNLRMPTINSVQIAGNVTRDPQLKHTTGGTAVCEIGLAVNRRWRDKSTGERREDTTFVDITCWNKTAEWAGETLKKGYPIYVSGRLKSDSWTDKATGAKRTSLKIQADNVEQLSWNNFDKGRDGQHDAAARPQPVAFSHDEGEIPF